MVTGCSHWHSEFERPLPLCCRPTNEKTDCLRRLTVSDLLAPASNVSFRRSVGFMEVPLTLGFGRIPVNAPHMRWRIERDYQDLGLSHPGAASFTFCGQNLRQVELDPVG